MRARTRRPNPGEGGAGEALYRQGSIHASYFHAWFPSSPRAVAALFGAGDAQAEPAPAAAPEATA